MNQLQLNGNNLPQKNLADAEITCDHFEMGTTLGHPSLFEINEEHLATHCCVLGATGSGKSKFLELLMRHFLVSKRGFALIDPHGDLSEDILAYAAYLKAARRDSTIAQRIHYLEPSFERTFHFDPFRFRPTKAVPAEFAENAYSAWLRAKADSVAQIFQRKQNQADFEGMPRLQRVLTSVLIASGTHVDRDTEEHLSLSDVMVLLDFSEKKHSEVYDRIRPHLEPEIAADFDRIKKYTNPEQRLRETESTINRLRSLFSPIVKAIFTQQAESIDFRSIVQNGEVLIINLRETDYFSADQRRALGGLFIHEILTTAQNEDRANRKPFHLIIDEAADFIGDDIGHALGIMRKFKLSMCLAAQDLSSFKKGDLDLRAKVLSQCGTKVCFNQSWPEDLDILARVLGTGNLSFDKHFQIVDRRDGYDWVDVEETSKSSQTGENWTKSTGTNASASQGESVTQSRSRTVGDSIAHGSSESTSNSSSDVTNQSSGVNEGTSIPRDGSLSDLHIRGSRQESESESRGRSQGSTLGSSESTSETRTASDSKTSGSSYGKNRSTTQGTSDSVSSGGSTSRGESTSYKKVPLSRDREERHEQPSLKNLISDQIERIKQTLFSLNVGEAVVKLRNEQQAFLIKTAHVAEKWTPGQKYEAIGRMKERCQEKPYFSVPNFSPSASEARIEEFIDSGRTAVVTEEPHKKDGVKAPFL